MSLRLSQSKDVSPDSHDLTGGGRKLDADRRTIDITRQLVRSGRTHSLGSAGLQKHHGISRKGQTGIPRPVLMVVMSSAVASLSTGFIDPVSSPIFLRLIPFCEIIPSFCWSFATENSS